MIEVWGYADLSNPLEQEIRMMAIYHHSLKGTCPWAFEEDEPIWRTF